MLGVAQAFVKVDRKKGEKKVKRPKRLGWYAARKLRSYLVKKAAEDHVLAAVARAEVRGKRGKRGGCRACCLAGVSAVPHHADLLDVPRSHGR